MEVKEKIKIKDLINFPFPITEVTGTWELEHVIKAVGLEYYEMDNDKFNPDLFQLKTIYNNPHDSDEASYRYLLFFKNEFACIFGKTGDRGTETVLFDTMDKKIALREYFQTLTPEYNDTSDILEDSVELSDNYTLFFQKDDDFYYHIMSPYWSFCFQKNTPLYLLEDDETLVPVTFIRFKLADRRDFSNHKKENQFMFVLKDKKEIEMPFDKVFFKIEK